MREGLYPATTQFDDQWLLYGPFEKSRQQDVRRCNCGRDVRPELGMLQRDGSPGAADVSDGDPAVRVVFGVGGLLRASVEAIFEENHLEKFRGKTREWRGVVHQEAARKSREYQAVRIDYWAHNAVSR